MLDQKRVAAMSKMSIYSKGESKKDIKICEYYKFDYISYNVIITSLWLMLIYAGIAACYCVVNIELMLHILLENELKSFLMKLLYGMIGTWLLFGIPSFFVYKAKFEKSQINAQKYYKELYKVNRFYAKEEQ